MKNSEASVHKSEHEDLQVSASPEPSAAVQRPLDDWTDGPLLARWRPQPFRRSEWP
jgi:hypothetical protein